MNRHVTNTLRRDGVYHFKKRVPKRLRFTDAFGGREFVQYTLGTRDADEAASMIGEALADFERNKIEAESELGIPAWDSSVKQRRLPKAPKSRPTIKQVELAADRFYRNYFQENSLIEDGFRSRRLARGLELLVAGKRVEDWEQIKSELDQPGEENLRSFDTALKVYENNNWIPDPDSKEFGVLHDLLRKAEKTAIEHILNAAESDKFIPSDERDALFLRSSETTYTLSAAVGEYAERNPLKRETIKKMRAAYGVWMDLIKIDSLAEIEKKTVVDFVELLKNFQVARALSFPVYRVPKLSKKIRSWLHLFLRFLSKQ
jgi:hypothetical protein